jgi:glycerol kinase
MLFNSRIDGGVSRNDFIVQHIANLTGKMIERRTSAEMSAFGIAFLAGLYSGRFYQYF